MTKIVKLTPADRVKNDNANPHLLVSGKHASEEQRFEALKDAYNNKQLIFTRARRYQKEKPDSGNTWYLIRLTSNEEIIYDGAFQMPVELETRLKAKDKLISYLTFQLLTQI